MFSQKQKSPACPVLQQNAWQGAEGESLAAALPTPLAKSGSMPGVLVRPRLCPLGLPLELFSSLLAGLTGRIGLLRETCPGCKPTDGRAWAERLPASQRTDDFQIGIFTATSRAPDPHGHLPQTLQLSTSETEHLLFHHPSIPQAISSSGGPISEAVPATPHPHLGSQKPDF